ncbi:hypothetical protein EJB05_12872, partial [Eragrostis curvula]
SGRRRGPLPAAVTAASQAVVAAPISGRRCLDSSSLLQLRLQAIVAASPVKVAVTSISAAAVLNHVTVARQFGILLLKICWTGILLLSCPCALLFVCLKTKLQFCSAGPSAIFFTVVTEAAA